MSLASQLVILKDHAGDPEADAFGDIDITKKTSITEFENAIPLSCRIVLTCRGGRFLTKGPIIKKWDRIFVRQTSKFGVVRESVFHVQNRKKLRQPGKGLQLELLCPHQSSNRLKVKVSLPNRRISGAEAFENLINQVNSSINRGLKDPEIVLQVPFDPVTKLGNRLDPSTSNDYQTEFVPLEKAVKNIIDKESSTFSEGGAQEFLYFRFISLYNHATHSDLDKIGVQMFEQGFMRNPGNGNFESTPQVTLVKNTIASGLRSDTETLSHLAEPETGTNLIAVGNKTTGSYPMDFAIYSGEKDAFNQVADWKDNVEYKAGRRISFKGAKYQCLIDHLSNNGNNPQNGLGVFWTGPLAFTPSLDYSPLTKDKAQYWINSLAGAKYASTVGGRTFMVDFNCVIKDPKHYRHDVDVVENDSVKVTLRTDLMINGLPYDGFRVLVVDPATGSGSSGFGDFSGNDKNDVPFKNNVVEFIDPDFDGIGEWVVVRETEIDDEIVDWEEALSWTYQPCRGLLTPGSPKDTCTLGARDSAWTKGAYGFITGAQGTGTGAQFRENTQFDCMHPVKRNGSGIVEVGNERISGDDISGTSATFINFDPIGDDSFVAGFNFHSLFPYSANGLPFGVVNVGEKIANPSMDYSNMFKNTKGNQSWFGQDVIDFFPLQGFRFWFQLIHALAFDVRPQDGNYNMAIWLMDRFRNKVVLDFVHGANQVISPADVPVGKKKTQLSVQGVASFIQSKQPEDTVIFDWKEVRKGGIVTKDSYDSQWKYISDINSILSVGTSNNRFWLARKIHLSIDSFRWSKPDVATNIIDISKPERNIMPQLFKASDVVSHNQLQNIINSQDSIFSFEEETFEMNKPARNEIEFGDPVYYTDKEAIDITTDGKPNTVKVVLDKEITTFSKPVKGSGGLTSTVYLKTRLFF